MTDNQDSAPVGSVQGGWIVHDGRPMPALGGRVEVKLRSGDCFMGSDLSDDRTWLHIWGEGDIVAYRMTPQTPPTDRPLTTGDVPLLREGDIIRRPNGKELVFIKLYECDPESLIYHHRDGSLGGGGKFDRFTFVARPAASDEGVGERDRVADAVHRGRFPADRDPTPFADEDPGGRAYCFRIADSVLAALASPPVSERERELSVRTGDLWWNNEDWEATFDNVEDAYDDATQGSMRGIVALGRATQHDTVFGVRIDIDTTGDGDADDYEIRLFPTREAALTAQPAGEGK